jgi:hypothetical protein
LARQSKKLGEIVMMGLMLLGGGLVLATLAIMTAMRPLPPVEAFYL